MQPPQPIKPEHEMRCTSYLKYKLIAFRVGEVTFSCVVSVRS